MNNSRRAEVIDTLKKVYAVIQLLDNAKEDFGFIADEEYNAIENLPDSFQNTEKSESMQNSYDALENAIDVIEEAFDNLMDLTTEVEEACGLL